MQNYDLSYENYVPPTEEGFVNTNPEHVFIKKVKALAEEMGVKYLVATHGGRYMTNTDIKDGSSLSEIAIKAFEVNTRPENQKINN